MPRVMIVDDEANLRRTLARTLRAEGYETLEAADGVEAVSRLHRGGVDALILDLSMPRMDGFGVLDALAEEEGAPPAIVLTAHASLDNAVRAVQAGAFDFLEKPPAAEALVLRLERALEHARHQLEREDESERAAGLESLIGEGPAMRALKEQIARVAATPARVLLLGENGTGKELVAGAIHALSKRALGPLVRVNCAALPAELFEAELFGHVKGAFTGAESTRRGRFERASGGTLFLDEIGEVPLASQPKLLRALEEGTIERLGAEAGTEVDARVVAATNRDLPALVAEGRFREDLFYRLEVVTLRVPALRERPEDLPALAAHFLARAGREMGRAPLALEEDALARLAREPWPGNVRQLRNLMERLTILARGERVGEAELARHLASAPASPRHAEGERPLGEGPLAPAVADYERRFIEAALARHEGHVTATARELGFDRSALSRKMKALGLRD